MDIDHNTHCYNIQKQTYRKGFLDASVDATYIIHLKDNGRLDHIQGQLTKYHPTKIVYIVFNDGFKKCNKKLIEQVSYQDLTDAFLQCFQHANDHHYNNILILEDDFIFSPDIKNKNNIKNINYFLNKNKQKEFIYYLGCNPILIFPCTMNAKHYYSYKSCSTHAIIYSKKTREKKLQLQYKHWDVIIEKSIPHRYLYHQALCYQTYPDTENKASWSEKDNIIIFNIKQKIITTLWLDKQPQPGFTILYIISKIFALLLFLLLFFFIYLIFIHFFS
jgi:hypothetical protein